MHVVLTGQYGYSERVGESRSRARDRRVGEACVSSDLWRLSVFVLCKLWVCFGEKKMRKAGDGRRGARAGTRPSIFPFVLCKLRVRLGMGKFARPGGRRPTQCGDKSGDAFVLYKLRVRLGMRKKYMCFEYAWPQRRGGELRRGVLNQFHG